MPKPVLKLDWCSRKAAFYAVMKWHYSEAMPVGLCQFMGVWEDGEFIGCVIFGRGASPQAYKSYGAKQTEACELVRVALGKHKTQVSRIIKVAMMLLKKKNPGLGFVFSFADPKEGHHGGIYQAGGWIYTGESNPVKEYLINGKWTHHRTAVASIGIREDGSHIKRHNYKACKFRDSVGKLRYIMPFNNKWQDKFKAMEKPYPKRARSTDSGAACNQQERGGATPTLALDRRGDAA